MYCATCKADVEMKNGYCPRCGTAAEAVLCPNGHVMDPSWTECKYCPPGAGGGGSGSSGAPGSKGRTVVESGGPSSSAGGQARSGGFTKGATLLEDGGRGPVGGKGRTVVDPRAGNKGKTIFDPGTRPKSADGGKASPRGQLPKLVGWLVSFTLDASGVDFRVREGRNRMGADQSCDIVVDDASVSGLHAVLMYRDGRFQLRDNDSVNGTYVNDTDVFGEGSVPVTDGDQIKIGNVEFILYVIDK